MLEFDYCYDRFLDIYYGRVGILYLVSKYFLDMRVKLKIMGRILYF